MCVKANGLFVWAAVSCNSIADSDLDPLAQYEELVGGGGVLLDTRASTQMKELYLKVLSKCHLDEPRALARFHQCLGAIIALKETLSIPAINSLLNINYAQYTLQPLNPVIFGVNSHHPYKPVEIIHQSFREFVTQGSSDPSSCEKYTIVESEHNSILTLQCLRLIRKEVPLLAEHTRWIIDDNRNPRSEIPALGHGVIPEAVYYACKYLMDHIDQVARLLPGLADACAHFMQDNIYGWLAVCAMIGRCQDFYKVYEYAQVRFLFKPKPSPWA